MEKKEPKTLGSIASTPAQRTLFFFFFLKPASEPARMYIYVCTTAPPVVGRVMDRLRSGLESMSTPLLYTVRHRQPGTHSYLSFFFFFFLFFPPPFFFVYLAETRVKFTGMHPVKFLVEMENHFRPELNFFGFPI